MNHDHEFRKSRKGDLRAPCPALNTLANHGYINRDGRNISILQLTRALREVFNLSFLLAIFLVLGAVYFCGHGLKLDLHSLAYHNLIEHDQSLVHLDARHHRRYAPVGVRRALVRKLLSYAKPGHGLALADFARARCERECGLRSLDSIHEQIALGESALTWELMKDRSDEVPLWRLRQFYADERIPTNYTPPQNSIGLFTTHRWVGVVASLMKASPIPLNNAASRTRR
ncbi:Chloroperoxidase [Infundibulicybe gibba]|nr:Chloroperoxidase [Infundibulicybe gibba]